MEAKITTFHFSENKIIPEKAVRLNYQQILASKEIRNFLILALKSRIEACTSQLFKNYNNVVHTSEHQIEFVIQSANKIHSYNIPSVNCMNNMIEWVSMYSPNYDIIDAPQGGWEQLGKALYWVEKPEKEFTIYLEKMPVKVSFGDIISLVWMAHSTQIGINCL